MGLEEGDTEEASQATATGEVAVIGEVSAIVLAGQQMTPGWVPEDAYDVPTDHPADTLLKRVGKGAKLQTVIEAVKPRDRRAK